MSATLSLSRRFLLRVMGAEILAPALRTLGRGLLSIFTLHRFTDPDLGVVGHDPALLRYHLAYLRRHHYRLFSLTDVVRQIENGGTGGWGGARPPSPSRWTTGMPASPASPRPSSPST